MSKYRTGEIVVQDVAVMIRVLKSDWEPGFPPIPQGQNLSVIRLAPPALF